MSERMVLTALFLAGATAALAQTGTQPVPEAESAPARVRAGDPWEAYEAGMYEQALSGFVDLQVERPDDPAVALNLGSVHYQMRNFEEADRAFFGATLSTDESLREQALYNLGNSAFRQGRLEEAVELYKAALEIDPDDEDAKFNLEFVRDEIRRRHEEAQKRQEEQQQQQQDQQQDQQQEQQQGGEDEQGQQEQGEQDQPQQQDQQQEEQQEQTGGQDSDQDGLPDEVERSGENPTDPENPDTDGDQLPDGAEDLNRNGQVDESETDPNNPDSDGDGVGDGEESLEQSQGGSGAEGEEFESLTPEEAERYLQALEEGQPVRRHPSQGRRRRPAKDW
ncbi:MAG: tetratricopeptide repeat protein [Thermoanaerobaculia bacterium]